MNMSDSIVSLNPNLDQLISEVREQFLLKRYSIKPTNYDQIDIEKVKTHDYSIKRFLVYQDLNKETALNQLDEALKWRKSFGVNDLNFSDFGVEIFKTGGIFSLNEDKEERPVLYIRIKTYTKIKQMDHILKKAFILMINKMDELAEEKGFVVFYDQSDFGFKNIDIAMARYMTKILKNYFPGALKRILLYNSPVIFSKILSIIMHFWGPNYSNIFQIINNREQIFDFIDKEKLPKYLGGNCSLDFTIPPPNCTLNSVELAEKHSIEIKDVKKFVRSCEPHIIEAKLLVLGEILK